MTLNDDRSRTFTLTPPRAPGGRPRASCGGGTPDIDEQSTLIRTLGAGLRAARLEAGMTQRVLALRSGVSHRSLQDLEAGRRRPSTAMLHALAVGSTRRIRPVGGLDPAVVVEQLVAAAGDSLVVDTPGGVRRRQRRLRDADHAYRRAVEAWWEGEVAAAQRAEVAFVTAMQVLELPGALDDAAALERAIASLNVHSRWLDEGRPGPIGTTRAFYDYCRSKGYPVSRRARWKP